MCQVFSNSLAWRIVLSSLLVDIKAYLAKDEPNSREIEIGSSTLSLRSVGKAVMRRENLASGITSVDEPVSDPYVAPDSDMSRDPFDDPEKGHHDPHACRNVYCTPNKAKRMGSDVPAFCKKGNLCTEEECCFGMCIDLPGHASCPIGSVPKPKSITPPACKESECTFGECCLGYCQKENCPDEISVFRNESDRPSHCKGYPCESEECCFGTCAGTKCPTGSIEKAASDQPAWCEGFPCKVEECCHPICEEKLCEQEGAETESMFYKVLRNFTGNENASTHCAEVPCKAEECCQGTCHETVCSKANPPMPESHWPSHCKGWECEEPECCEGRCTELFCEHHSSVLRQDVTAETECAAEPCLPLECCAGTCTSDHCPEDFGLKVRTDAPQHCSNLQCRTEECCSSFCTKENCPESQGYELKQKPVTECEDAVCKSSECCDIVEKR